MLFQQESYLHHSSYNYNTHTHTLFNPQNAIKHLTSRQDLNHYQAHFSPPTTRFRHFVFPTCTATFTIPLSLFTQFLPSLVPFFVVKESLLVSVSSGFSIEHQTPTLDFYTSASRTTSTVGNPCVVDVTNTGLRKFAYL